MVIQLALMSWFPITIGLFLYLRPHMALSVSMISGIILLPALRSFKVPILPALDQSTIPTIACFVMTLLVARSKLMSARPGRGPEILVGFMILASLGTNLTNMDPISFGVNVLPAMGVMDTIYDAVLALIRWGMPFMLGRALIRTREEARGLLLVLAFAGLFYIPFVLVELSTGPLFHRLVYGSYPAPTTFAQSIKFGGFRPSVLMTHGLTLSIFMLYSTIAWLTLAKARCGFAALPSLPVVGVMGVVVALCKSVAVYAYGMLVLPALFVLRPKRQLAICLGIAIVVLGYPTLRATGLVPVDQMRELAEEQIGTVAAQSLMARMTTEEEIITRVRERMPLGWGGYARYQIFDPRTGEGLSTMDGFWLITFGSGGAARFVFLFLMLLYPIFYAYRRIELIPSRSTQYLICGMAWIVAVRTFDLLPNSDAEAYLTIFSGATYGVTQYQVARAKAIRARKQRKRTVRDPERSWESQSP